MTLLIIDTPSLIRAPELLARGGTSDVEIVVPWLVQGQLARHTRSPGAQSLLKYLLEEAAAGRVKIEAFSPDCFGTVRASNAVSKLDAVDEMLLSFALGKRAADRKVRVILVTEDSELAQAARDNGLDSQTAAEVVSAISAAPVNSQSERQAHALTRFQARNLALSAVGGGGLATLGNVAWNFRSELFDALPDWGPVVGAVLAGFALFWFRQRKRLAYGFTEVCAGAFGAWNSSQALLSDQPPALSSVWLALLSSVYIVVRGLDNVGVGIAGTRAEAMWQWAFAPRRSSNKAA